MKKIDTEELNELLIITENAQRILSMSADDHTRNISKDVLTIVQKRVKELKKAAK